jgi:hypothetical protein
MAVKYAILLEILDERCPDKAKRYRELSTINFQNRTDEQARELSGIEWNARKMLGEAKGLSGSDLEDFSRLTEVVRAAVFERLREPEV